MTKNTLEFPKESGNTNILLRVSGCVDLPESETSNRSSWIWVFYY